MRVVLQRVKEASVSVHGREVSRIGAGHLVLVGVSKGDTKEDAEKMALKTVKLRVFEDRSGKMNLSVKDVNGQILSVPQFTLYGSAERGNRPGFDEAALAEEAKKLWSAFNGALRVCGVTVEEGSFGEHMEVSLVNDGPATFILDSRGVIPRQGKGKR